MSIVSTEITIDAPTSQVWDALKNVGDVHKWHPKVKTSPLLSASGEGVGASRQCNFYDGTSVVETVTAMEDGKWLEIALSDFSMPLSRAEVRIDLQPTADNKTILRFAMDYDTKYGPIGWLMDAAMINPMMNKMFKTIVGGLDHHVVTGELVGEDGAVSASTANAQAAA